MQKTLFDNETLNTQQNPPLLIASVMRSAFLEPITWQEFHDNGQLWMDGQIALVPDELKHLYDYRTGFKGYEDTPVCRIGKLTKYFDNGQIAWGLDYGDGTHDYKGKEKFPSYRKDGSVIVSTS